MNFSLHHMASFPVFFLLIPRTPNVVTMHILFIIINIYVLGILMYKSSVLLLLSHFFTLGHKGPLTFQPKAEGALKGLIEKC